MYTTKKCFDHQPPYPSFMLDKDKVVKTQVRSCGGIMDGAVRDCGPFGLIGQASASGGGVDLQFLAASHDKLNGGCYPEN